MEIRDLNTIPLVATLTGPQILDPSYLGGNILTVWDRDWFNQYRHLPRGHRIIVEGHEEDRQAFHDRIARERRLGFQRAAIEALRTDYWQGRAKTVELLSRFTISGPSFYKIIQGRDYWWCGGGIPYYRSLYE